MSKMLYRIYPKGESVLNPNSKHYTLVECKDGSFLEVKNPDNNNTKTKFESVEAWASSHDTSLEDVNADDNYKPDKKPKGPEIKIPDANFQYGYWLYNTVSKFEKKLLKNPEFIEAFNNFYDAYNKHKSKMYVSDWELVRGAAEKYNPKWITFKDKFKWDSTTERETQLGGLSWSFKASYYGNDAEIVKALKEEQDKISGEIKPLYKTLCEILAPTLLLKLEKKYETMKAKATIADSKRRLKVYDNAIRKVMYKIEYNMRRIQGYEKDIKHYKKTKEEYQKKIEEAEAKMAKFEKKKSQE